MMETLTLIEAAKLCHCHTETIRLHLKAGRIRGRKVGRSWIMTPKAIEEFLMGVYDETARQCQTEERQGKWHCIKEGKRGGFTSSRQAEKELDALLALKTRNSHSSYMTS